MSAAQRDPPPGRRIEGIVVDVLGDPIPSARLVVEHRDGPSRQLQSDGQGRFAVARLPRTAHRRTAHAEGHCAGSLPIDPDGPADANMRITLLDAVTVSGRVLDEPGRAIQGAHVLVDAPWKTLVECESHAVTGANGRYELAHVPVGDVRLVVLAPGHRTSSESMTLARSATRNFTLPIGPAATYRIRVAGADDEDWRHLSASIEHRVTGNDVGWRLGAIWPKTRDGDHLVLADLPVDLRLQRIAIDCGPHGTSPSWNGPPREPGTHDFTTRVLRQQAKAVAVRICGVVRDPENLPVPGLCIRNEHRGTTDMTTTAVDGTFELATSLIGGPRFSLDVGDDGYLVRPRPEDWRPQTTFEGRHEDGRVHQFVVQRATRVTGRVVDSQGEPVFGAEAQLLVNEDQHAGSRGSRPDRIIAWAWTSRDGSFVFPRVNGRSDFDAWLTVRCTSGQLHLGPLPLPPQGALDLGPLQLAQTGWIEGVFTDAQGRPQAGRAIRVWHDDAWLPPMREWSGYTDRDGRFRFWGLPAGDFHVRGVEPFAGRWTLTPDFAFVRLQAGERAVVQRGDDRR